MLLAVLFNFSLGVVGGHHCRVIVSEAGVLLKIVRNNRWVEMDWLAVALVAMVAPLRPRTVGRTSSPSGLRLRSSNHRSP